MTRGTPHTDSAETAKNWNVLRVSAAYAGGMLLPSGKLSERRQVGDRVWAVASVPLLDAVQGISYLDYNHRRPVADVAAYSTWTYGARLNSGNATWNFFYELLGEGRTNPPVGVKKRSSAWSGGLEFLAAEGVWVSTGFGKRAQELLTPDRTVVLANVRWGIAKKSFLSAAP